MYSIIPSEKFKKEYKRLAKKFPSLKKELLELNTILVENPTHGTPLGNNTYKIRVAIKSKGKGKSGGSRVITYIVAENEEVYLLTIFDKSEFDTIDDKSIEQIIDSL
jgi:mRNA-degrading endonuclease RelE of RelBE toxin-antitoxin system